MVFEQNESYVCGNVITMNDIVFINDVIVTCRDRSATLPSYESLFSRALFVYLLNALFLFYTTFCMSR